MAQTLQGIEQPARFTLTTTQTLIRIPAGTDYLIIAGETIGIYFCVGDDDDDGAALPAHFEWIAASTPTSRSVRELLRRGKSVLLATDGPGDGGTVEVTPVGAGR